MPMAPKSRKSITSEQAGIGGIIRIVTVKAGIEQNDRRERQMA